MKRKRMWTMRSAVLLAVLVGFTAVIATFVIAKYIKNDEVGNSFSPAVSENPQINEEFDHEVKKDVSFEVNPAGSDIDYPVYFRVAIVVTWQKKEGDSYIVHFTKPVENVDYEMTLNVDEKDDTYGGTWTFDEDDGYYYYNIPVPSGGKTPILIEYCAPVKDPANQPEGYFLSVDIIVQTVQAVGYTDDEDEIPAWQDAWAKYDAVQGESDTDTTGQ